MWMRCASISSSDPNTKNEGEMFILRFILLLYFVFFGFQVCGAERKGFVIGSNLRNWYGIFMIGSKFTD